MVKLLEPVYLGDLKLPNRIVMAPLTRSRAGAERIPNRMMRDYYVQRADAGLILSEATAISPMGVGYADTPGIWSIEQIEGWKGVTDGVHQAGGRIFLQLWHVGRISDPKFLNGATPVAPSAIQPDGKLSLQRQGHVIVKPRALENHEVKQIVQDYKQGAINAKEAGFDGVEIHAANGYLIDQFLQTGTNERTDEYGGSVENRARFLLEVTDALISVWGNQRVGVHLAPRGDSNYISDANPRETFSYVAKELGQRKIAFIFAREKQGEGYLTPTLKEIFGGHFIANEGLDLEKAESLIEKGIADSVSFGKLYISNPDLVSRIKFCAPLEPFDVKTFYTPGPAGYTDYPKMRG
ncbi:MAG: alkene reductase [Pseudobdellovibrionaceae bacterium]